MALTESQHREVQNVIRSLSGDLLVDPMLIVEAIQDDDNIHALLNAWLYGRGVVYDDLLLALGEVF
jgi:hypothetical protein